LPSDRRVLDAVPLAGEANTIREAVMAEPHVSSSTGATVVAGQAVSLEQRKDQLVETLRLKAEQGYMIESQTDTEAVLVSKGRPSRWLGLVGGGHDTRQAISIDGRGRAITRSL
jgi:hypothetical protein